MTVVDIHCHVFTGKDIPVYGFLRSNGAPEVLARLVDRVIQGGEPDEALAAAGLAAGDDVPDDVVDDVIRRIRRNDPEVDGLIKQELTNLTLQAGFSPIDWFQVARRYVRWGMLLRKDIPAITDKMIDTYDKNGVDLYTPAMMDMENWLGDKPKTKFETQIQAMKALTLDQKGKVHPLIAFDPKRQLDAGKSLALVKDAILERGFVGVKVYPPMGYQPIDNGGFKGGDAAWDGALAALFEFCLAEDVPVMTHCTGHGAEAGHGKGRHSHVKHWKRLLEQAGYEKLRLNLAHFGSDEVDQKDPDTGLKDDWTEQVVELMARFPHVYADVGAHSVAYGAPYTADYVSKLKSLLAKSPVLADRLMLGTDWHTIVRNPKHEAFISRYQELFTKAFGVTALPKLNGANALAFLGLDKPGGMNRSRLEAFYAKHGIAKPKWWVA